MSASKVLPRLREQLEKANALINANEITESDFTSWRTETHHWLVGAFGEDDRNVRQVLNAGPMRVRDSNWSSRQLGGYLRGLLQPSASQLKTVIGLLEHAAADEAAGAATSSDPAGTQTSGTPSKKVFIVHGHDDAAKHAAARFVSQLKLIPVILHEQANEGNTIIEKLEAHAKDAAYAVVLLTPDDRGGTVGAPYEDQKPRARQNVILELGYFLAALGRKRVCALYKSGTDIPSDYSGVIFISMDPNEGWKLPLAKEIKKVIPAVDMNDAF